MSHSSSCQGVYFVQSKPKLAIKVTKAILLVRPVAVEIHSAIQLLLGHCPSPASRFLVANFKVKSSTIRVDFINTIDCFARFVQLGTVLILW